MPIATASNTATTTDSAMSLSMAADRRIAGAAFGASFGVSIGPGRDPAAKAPREPRQLANPDAQRKGRALTAAQKDVAARVGEMIGSESWGALMSIEREALEVADALRRQSPADSVVIYGSLGHAHLTTMLVPVPIYADHGMSPIDTYVIVYSCLCT